MAASTAGSGSKAIPRSNLIDALMQRHGRTYCEQLGIPIEQGTPSPLFRWLVASILFSARISADTASSAARALDEAGWRTAGAMAKSSWEQRTKVLNRSGYARYDESTSRMLGESATMLVESYGGDLRKLREKAGEDPKEERRLLKEFKGLGDVGVDIFFREAQAAWSELYPFLDRRALDVAGDLGLPKEPRALAEYVDRRDFPRLATALARTALAHDADEIRSEADA
jgi:hypothetical protein